MPSARPSWPALRGEPHTGPVPEGYDLDLCLDDMASPGRGPPGAASWNTWSPSARATASRCSAARACSCSGRRPSSAAAPICASPSGARPGPTASDTPALSREFVSFGSGDAWRRMLERERLAAPRPAGTALGHPLPDRPQHLPAPQRQLRPGPAAAGGHPTGGRTDESPGRPGTGVDLKAMMEDLWAKVQSYNPQADEDKLWFGYRFAKAGPRGPDAQERRALLRPRPDRGHHPGRPASGRGHPDRRHGARRGRGHRLRRWRTSGSASARTWPTWSTA